MNSLLEGSKPWSFAQPTNVKKLRGTSWKFNTLQKNAHVGWLDINFTVSFGRIAYTSFLFPCYKVLLASTRFTKKTVYTVCHTSIHCIIF